MKSGRMLRRMDRGQSVVETVMAMVLVMLIFCALLQVAYLYMGKMIANHAAFCAARSNAVGFRREIVARAMEVGSIGFSGHLLEPQNMAGRSPAELGAIEHVLIKEFISAQGYTMVYEHWPLLGGSIPANNFLAPARVSVHMYDYPLQMPMHRAYTGDDDIDFGASARLLNHAGFYLE